VNDSSMQVQAIAVNNDLIKSEDFQGDELNINDNIHNRDKVSSLSQRIMPL